MIISTAVLCLAMNVYMEARSEMIPGQYAVALVTMNRAGRDPKRICAEVFKPSQFSWANDRVVKVKGGWQIPSDLRPREAHAWDLAFRVASWTLAGNMPDFTNGSTYYHTKAVKPAWRKAFEWTTTIGAHVFYRDPSRQSVVTASL